MRCHTPLTPVYVTSDPGGDKAHRCCHSNHVSVEPCIVRLGGDGAVIDQVENVNEFLPNWPRLCIQQS